MNRRDLFKGIIAAPVVTSPIIRVALADPQQSTDAGDALAVAFVVKHCGSQMSYDPMQAIALEDGAELRLRCVDGELQADVVRPRK